jgi:hypothetical protein
MPDWTERLLCHRMTCCVIASLLFLACSPAGPTQRYGFIARLGRDTLSVESVTRRGNTETIEGVDRFPRVRERHTEIELGPDGGIRHLVMQIYTPSEPANQQHRLVVADVTRGSVRVSKKDGTGTIARTFATDGGTAMAHVPQMYSLYELYFAAALERARALKRAFGDTVQLRQFYIDREFDQFPLHHGVVRPLAGGKGGDRARLVGRDRRGDTRLRRPHASLFGRPNHLQGGREPPNGASRCPGSRQGIRGR